MLNIHFYQVGESMRNWGGNSLLGVPPSDLQQAQAAELGEQFPASGKVLRCNTIALEQTGVFLV